MEAQQLRRQRLLLIEGDPDSRRLLSRILVKEGFEIEVASDGSQALAILRQAAFDLIVLDLLLPRRGAWTFRVVQRADAVLSTIPVVATSADVTSRVTAIDAAAYLPKPFKAAALLAAIRRVLEQRRIMHLDRLASLGTMAAGIAHEVNNPLTYVHANLVLAQEILTKCAVKLAPDAKDAVSNAKTALGKALEGIERVRSIMSGVRLFIRAPDDHRVAIDVRTIIETSLMIIAHNIEQKATVVTTLGEVPQMMGNPGQLGQLVVNLISNAADSIAPASPGPHRIIVRTSTSDSGEVVLEVEDTGCGMVESVRSQIFEPFFTTKPPGLGTGLGLSVCHGIVRGHDGNIDVESTPGKGTSFRVVFPPARRTIVPVAPDATPDGRLMIIEDNEHVADALAGILGQDYEDTVVVADGGRATALLEEQGASFEVILCDMQLGRTTGKQIYERLSTTRPELVSRIVFMSGAALSATLKQFLDEIPNPFLQKLFDRSEFRKAVAGLPRPAPRGSETRLKAVSADSTRLEQTRRLRTKRS